MGMSQIKQQCGAHLEQGKSHFPGFTEREKILSMPGFSLFDHFIHSNGNRLLKITVVKTYYGFFVYF